MTKCPYCGIADGEAPPAHHHKDCIRGVISPNEIYRARTGRSLYFNRQGEPVDDMLKWADGMQDNQVALHEIRGYKVSTVFLGVDSGHGVITGGPPMLFETMIFAAENGDELDLRQWRYPTEAAAVAGHDQVVATVRDRLAELDQFEAAYAERSGVTVEWLHEHGRHAKPCHCSEDECEGWQMAHDEDD